MRIIAASAIAAISVTVLLAVPLAPAHAQAADPSTPTRPDDTQDHDMAAMPGMAMSHDGHAGHVMAAPPADHAAHDDHDMAAMPAIDMTDASAKTGTDQAPGDAAPPVVQHGLLSDRYFDAGTMARAHDAMLRGHGGGTWHQILINIAEYQVSGGHGGYRWDAQAWLGDVDRLALKTQGEGGFHDKVDAAEVQALYSKALDPWWNLQLGVRHDFQPAPSRTYAAIGVEGLAPYAFDLNAALFLSSAGNLLGRVEGTYDERITQRLILQPRIELNCAAQDVPESQIGAGLVDAELGLRLRYEFSPKFAPYVGLSWTWRAGRTADYARLAGRDVAEAHIVLGLRAWL